jgi:Alr-MurF fusion protein
VRPTISHIARILHADSVIRHDGSIQHLAYDSRRIDDPAQTVFFAFNSERRNGHDYIPALYKNGVRNFVVTEKIRANKFREANFLRVKDPLDALQTLASWHRKQFHFPVIGITGSTGKTIVKEWLYQLLHKDYNIIRSPKSFNSQIGVPLSVWQMMEENTLGIFEAGISRPGEMKKLQRIIRPTIGILTNIGEAHSEGFQSVQQKKKEKEILFRDAKRPARLFITKIKKANGHSTIFARVHKTGHRAKSILIPFSDDASIQNAVTCWELMLMLGYGQQTIRKRMKLLEQVDMRLEMKKGINHCTIINDSYSADLDSLQIALDFMQQQPGYPARTVILSDFLQTGLQEEELYKRIAIKLNKRSISRVIGIGEKISQQLKKHLPAKTEQEFYRSTGDFISQYLSSRFKEEIILVKGARVFGFENIVQILEQKAHQTVLEIDLSAIVHNLRQYQHILKPGTKIMAMVKAFAYGSGGIEIANVLEQNGVDHLGVAYTDEGVELRKSGIHLPVMVMNPEENSFAAITENRLEPEIYSFQMLSSFEKYLQKENIPGYPMHVELETGMNRLGFSTQDVEGLARRIRNAKHLKLQSVFTHLVASEEKMQDGYTREQYKKFTGAAGRIEKILGYNLIKHIANSAAITRFPSMQMDMVRLGIGLYGIDSTHSAKLNLIPAATLRSTVSQVKKIKKGESVGYNRKSIVKRDTRIATIRIGYADGYPRRLGNGVGKVWIKGKLVPIIGTVCMDMLMTDISSVDGVKEGDDVIIFGKQLPIEKLAAWAGTIPYEIMTGISQRVKRVYFEE